MKLKTIITGIAAAALLTAPAYGETLSYGFENSLDGLTTVTNTLGSGGSAVYGDGFNGAGLTLNGSYGLNLGEVGTEFTVGAMVNITSSGGTQTIFFKNMGSKSSEKWLSVISDNGTPAFWANGGGFSWKRIVTGNSNILNNWAFVVYTEKDGTGSLYVDGKLAGSGSVAASSGTVYAGTTYWSADAPHGALDELIFDNEKALSAEEISAKYTELEEKLKQLQYEAALNALTLPSKTKSDITLPSTFDGKAITWVSSDTSVITNNGKVTQQNEDAEVIMTAYVDGEAVKTFNVTVLKLPVVVNQDVVLSYSFDDGDGVVADKSGNGNHGTIHGGMANGVFDGVDDYVEMPEGILANLDEFTIIMRLTPAIAQTHQFTFGFGNSSGDGYFFLNTSRPGTKTIRLAITGTSYGGEKDIKSFPGIHQGQEAVIVVTSKGTQYSMYIDGIPAASGDMGMAVKDLGETKLNYLGKSFYNGDPYFKGEFKEFTILPYEMDAAEIREAYEIPEDTDTRYIDEFALTENGLEAVLTRNCMVSAVFYDNNGKEIYSAVKKVSDDNLSLSFDCVGGASAEITAFDGADGIIKEKYAVAVNNGVLAYTLESGTVKVVNTTDKTTNAAVINAGYVNNGSLSSADITTVTVAPNSFELIPAEFNFDNQKIFVWTSLGEMTPVIKLN